MYILRSAILMYSTGEIIIGIVIGTRYNPGSSSSFVHMYITCLVEQEVKKSSWIWGENIKDNKSQAISVI